MWEWILGRGWYVLVTLVVGVYLAVYVAAVRRQREDPRKRHLPADRC